MIGCPVAWKCLVACWFGESSQQPTWPQLRQIRKCSHTLPLCRHSSQPSALGVTVRMPAMWLQALAITRSQFARVEEIHLDTAGCEFRQVSCRGLSFRACECGLDIRRAVEGQH